MPQSCQDSPYGAFTGQDGLRCLGTLEPRKRAGNAVLRKTFYRILCSANLFALESGRKPHDRLSQARLHPFSPFSSFANGLKRLGPKSRFSRLPSFRPGQATLMLFARDPEVQPAADSLTFFRSALPSLTPLFHAASTRRLISSGITNASPNFTASEVECSQL